MPNPATTICVASCRTKAIDRRLAWLNGWIGNCHKAVGFFVVLRAELNRQWLTWDENSKFGMNSRPSVTIRAYWHWFDGLTPK
jgi:hypothetical protein